ncbi:asparagine synthetase B family protein [Azospirillum aestuarii]|uniref:asparagine synthetase B family protein n=1 Tax=Azospirillum aestuarii TaxID=2802052 RepID=UPI004054F783
MSRIAGIITAQAPKPIDSTLAAMATGNDWKHSTVSAGAAAFGWVGRRAPALAAQGGWIVTLDGTIFNPEELPSAASDAERLLELVRRHGMEEALARINGDFAAAVYDAASDTLWLGRDRIGLKPLYYVQQVEGVAFASRPAGLLALPWVPQDVDQRFVALFAGSHYRSIDNDPQSSPYAAIRQLPAGHVLSIRDGRAKLSRYWQLSEASERLESEAELAEEMRALLLDAVRRRIAVTRSPAFTLSGGLDSSSVLSCAVELSGKRQPAFSSTYADATYDETEEIRSMLDDKVSTWNPVRIGGFDLLNTIRDMVRVHDEPVVTATWLSHHLLTAEVARQGYDALFGGLGGDELNAGEYEYFFFHFADLRAAGKTSLYHHEVACWAKHHDHPVFRKNAFVAEEGLARMTDALRPGLCLPDRRRLDRYAAAVEPGLFDLRGWEPVMDHPFRSCLRNRTFQDIFRETAPCCLRAEDRQTAAHGLDRFDPFFDHRLVEFMFRVPGHFKIRDGITKRLLREAMRDLLPEETRTRVKKTGWNAPAHLWFAGPDGEAMRDLIASQRFRELGIYNVAVVEGLLDDHERIVASGALQENHMMFFWQLANLAIWLGC